jgi:hypothetical protein
MSEKNTINSETNELTTNKNIYSTNNFNVFDFIKDPEKLNTLIHTNNLLKINKHKNNKLIFVYSAPKVGSTSIVSSLRIFGMDKIDIIHIHDEEMLSVLASVKNITVNEIILFNKYLERDVYVINVYRSPIERKISTFFEKVGSYHFNNEDSKVNFYNINKVIDRFNNIFPWIGNGDHFLDRYNITVPEKFDFNNKFLLVNENDINYITLRLKDSNEWDRILTNIFGFNIRIIKDYESTNKPIKDLYNNFKLHYRIPSNLLEDLKNDKFLKYYYSNQELNNYFTEWSKKSTSFRQSYTNDEYNLYEKITLENTHIDIIQSDHYFDEGCNCKACNLKRMDTISKILRGQEVKDRIIHTEAKTELIQKRVNTANNINKIISKLPLKTRGKDFNRGMTNIVSFGK